MEQKEQIKVGDSLPTGLLYEFNVIETPSCALGPQKYKIEDLVKDKNIALFALPGAFTPTCSAQHVPGFLKLYDELKGAGIDEIWCVSVNDAFVMGQWAKDQGTQDKIRMLGDGGAVFTKNIGLSVDLTDLGYGIRSQRYSALVVNGKVVTLNVEQKGKFEVSNAEVMLEQAKQHIKKE